MSDITKAIDHDVFWGSALFELPGSAQVKCYPVTGSVAARLRQSLSSGSSFSGLASIETMNNRIVLFAPKQMKRILIVPDEADWPANMSREKSGLHDYTGIPVEAYRLMGDYADEEAFDKAAPIAMRKLATTLITEGGFTDRPDDLRKLLRHTVIEFADGTSTSYEADRGDLAELAEIVDDPDLEIVKLSASDDDFECFYPLSMLRMIDIPMIELEAAQCG